MCTQPVPLCTTPFVSSEFLQESVNYEHPSKLFKMCKRGWSFGVGTDHAICDIDRENFTACSFFFIKTVDINLTEQDWDI